MPERETQKGGLWRALAWCTALSLVTIVTLFPIASRNLTNIAGPIILCLGLLPLTVLKWTGRSISSVGADVAFGAFDTGFMMAFAVAGLTFTGILGALIGAGAGDAITDAYAGIVEGKIATWLRERGIDEARVPISASLGKMSGCLLGAGVTISLAAVLGLI